MQSMSLDNPLEIIITVLLVLASIWLVERIIAGAFKTVVAAVFIVGVLLFFSYTQQPKKKEKPLPKFNVHDLTDYESFSKKAEVYKTQTIKDIEDSYKQAKEDLNHK
jgi:hypothetical protein